MDTVKRRANIISLFERGITLAPESGWIVLGAVLNLPDSELEAECSAYIASLPDVLCQAFFKTLRDVEESSFTRYPVRIGPRPSPTVLAEWARKERRLVAFAKTLP